MSQTLYRDIRQTRARRQIPARTAFRIDRQQPPDAFLRVPRGTQARRGSASTAAMHRAKQLAARLGL